MSLTGMLLYLVFTQERIDQCSSGVMILLSQDYLSCPTHVVLCFCFVCPMLPVSLDCPFLIAPSVFSNIYFRIHIRNRVILSKLSWH